MSFYDKCRNKSSKSRSVRRWDAESNTFLVEEIANEDYKEPCGQIIYAMNEVENEHCNYMMDKNKWTAKIADRKFFYNIEDRETVWKYLDERPWEPWVMINISPDWKGRKITASMVEDLSTVIRRYMNEGYYSEWHYSIESGGEGNHLHTHIVCKLGTVGCGGEEKTVKAVKTHLGHGNHTQQLKKWANKTKGLKGLIKGTGVQKVFLNHKILWQDKMKYLIESKKPDGHKNQQIDIPCNFKFRGKYTVN